MVRTQLYMLTAPSGKRYIGVTKKPVSYRVNEHSHAKTVMGRAVRKYGTQIEAVVLAVGNEGYIYDLEHRAIEAFGTMAPHGYNLREGGQGGRHTEESKRKIGNAIRGKTRSPETRARIGAASKGRKFSKEVRQKMSQDRKGRLTGSKNPMWGVTGEAHPCWGKVPTTEARKNMSQGQNQRRARERGQ